MRVTADRGGWRGLVVAGVLVLGAAACGPGDNVERAEVQPGDPTGSAGGADTTDADATPGGGSSAGVQLVRDATDATREVTSGRFELTMTGTDVPELGGEDVVVLRVDGAFDNTSARSQVTVDMSGSAPLVDQPMPGDTDGEFADLMAGLLEPVTIVTDGDTVYTRSSLFNGVLGVPTPWVSSPVEGGAEPSTGVESFAVDDVAGFLGVLDTVGQVTETGTEDLDGVTTTVYRVDIDPAEIDELADDEFYGGLGDPTAFPGSLEVWIDGDGIIRRLLMELDASAMAEGTGEPSGGQMRLELRFTGIGEPVDIVVPDPSEVTDLTTWEPDLGALFEGEVFEESQVPTTPTTGG